MRKLVVCLDFDDVINDYPGWENEGFVLIRGKPVRGAKRAIRKLRKSYIVYVNSTRCAQGGRLSIVRYLRHHGIKVDGVTEGKPRADFYIDDRGIQFTDWISAISQLENFKHYKPHVNEYIRAARFHTRARHYE